MGHLQNLHDSAVNLRNDIHTEGNIYSSGIKWVLVMSLLGGLKLVVGILAFLVSLSMTGFVIVLLFGGGWLLVLVRFLIIWMCEPLRDNVGLLTDVINIIVKAINLFMPIYTTITDTEINILNEDLDAIERVFHVQPINVPVIPQYKPIATVSKAELIRVFTTIPIVCTKYDTMPSVVVFFTRLGLHSITCPAVLISYADPTLYDDAMAISSWTMFGSAAPFPSIPGDNCNGINNLTVYDTVCATMGFGYVMVFLLTPMALIFMLLVFTYSGLFDLTRAMAYYAYLMLRLGVTKLVFLLDELFD